MKTFSVTMAAFLCVAAAVVPTGAQPCMETGTYPCTPDYHAFPGGCYAFGDMQSTVAEGDPQELTFEAVMLFEGAPVAPLTLQGTIDCVAGTFSIPVEPGSPIMTWQVPPYDYGLYILSFEGELPAPNLWRGTIEARVTEDGGVFPFCDDRQDAWTVEGEMVATGVDMPPPGGLALRRLPNPFLPGSSIAFELAPGSETRLSVYDAQGRAVTILADGSLGAGLHRRVWDGRRADGLAAPAGVYFVRLETADGVRTGKLILAR